jgi:DNA-binding LacI/PurR family transcriptional regulator
MFDWLRQGEFAAGEKLPSERQLTDLFGLNHQTIRRALLRLENEGYIENRPRIGRFVRDVSSGALVKQIVLALPSYLSNNHPAIGAWLGGMHNIFESSKFSISSMFYRPGHFEFDISETLIRRRVQGLMFMDNGITARSLQKLIDSGVHVMQLGLSSDELIGLGLPTVSLSVAQALNDLFDGLVKRQCKSIVILRYSADYGRDEIDLAVAHAIERFGHQANFKLVPLHNENFTFDANEVRAQLTEANLPDAIFVPDEFVAREVLRLAYRNNWRLPDRLSLASLYNNAPDLSPLSLAHIVGFNESARMLETASQSLLARINGETIYTNRISLTCEVKWGESIRPLLDPHATKATDHKTRYR